MSAAESYTFKLSKGPSAFDTACFANIFRYDASKGEDEAGRSGIWWRDVGRLAVPAALGRSIVLKASLDLRSATMGVTVALDDAPAGEEEAFVIFNGRERQSSLSLPGVKKNLLIGASRTGQANWLWVKVRPPMYLRWVFRWSLWNQSRIRD